MARADAPRVGGGFGSARSVDQRAAMSDHADETVQRALVACAAWLHAGYVGAATLAVGLLQMAGAGARSVAPLALVLFGAMLAVAGLLRARGVLDATMASRAPGATHGGPAARRGR